ncbi:MAG: efflux RND transporter permease subunit [Nitrospira sp.]
MDKVIAFALGQRIIIVTAACVLIAGGIYSYQTIPIDAFPDATPIYVQVVTKSGGLSPEEVERFITFPLELQLAGSPGLREIRSRSKVGLSLMTVVFDDAIDIYLARQVVNTQIQSAQRMLPPGSSSEIVPNSTAIGEVYQYFLQGPHDDDREHSITVDELRDRRTLQDWVLRPLLLKVPDIVDVKSHGGFVKQYQVLLNPDLLRKYDLAVRDVFHTIEKNNANAGGNILENYGEKSVIRGLGLIESLRDIEHIVLREFDGTPVYVRDVAEVRFGEAVRHGAVVYNGKREVVSGIVMLLRGGNARDAVEGIKRVVDEIHRKGILPGNLTIKPFYDRAELISKALNTVYLALLEGIGLVVLVLFVFLGNVRSALIVTATLLTAPFATLLIMKQVGITANLMSLGGLAIAIGMMVDGSIVMVENIFRMLSEQQRDSDLNQLVKKAAAEVARPVIFGTTIIIVVFLPLLSLQGVEGKMFSPLAYTIMIALMCSLMLSIFLSPVLASLTMRKGSGEDTWVVRWIKKGYKPVLIWSIAHRVVVLMIAVVLLAASLAIFPFLGGEFIPNMNELAITPQTIRHPSIALEESIEIEKQMQRAALEVPETKFIVSKIGRSETGNDPQEPNASDPVLALKPIEEWTTGNTKAEIDDAVRQRIQRVTGASYVLSQPIQQRMDEVLSGVRTDTVVKVLGEDLQVLRSAAETIRDILASTNGVKDVRVEQLFGQSYVTVTVEREKLARHGINVSDIHDIIRVAIGAEPVTTVYEGNRRFDLILRFPKPFRDRVDHIKQLLLRTMTGALVPLGDIALVEAREGPAMVSREGLKRRIYIGFNTLGRDIESVVKEAKQEMGKQLDLPTGYEIVWDGSFKNMQRAMARLKIVVPITVALIFFLLFSSFNSLRYASLIILNLPFALIGGIVALWISGEYLSVPASVGFINLFGVAVLNGIVLVSYILKLHEDGQEGQQAIINACMMRLRPVLMTALTGLLGLVPLALAHGVGSEVQRPLAIVVIGGLVTSTFLTLLVLPSIFPWFEPTEKKSTAR